MLYKLREMREDMESFKHDLVQEAVLEGLMKIYRKTFTEGWNREDSLWVGLNRKIINLNTLVNLSSVWIHPRLKIKIKIRDQLQQIVNFKLLMILIILVP